LAAAGCRLWILTSPARCPFSASASIRTILSQNTTNNNSARAYASLLERFGPSKANSRAVSLPAVFRADLADVQDSIRCGGLANVKGKVITGVLKTVYDRNAKLEAAEASVTKEAAAVPEASAQPAVKEESKPAAVKDEPDAGASLAAAALAAPSASTAKRASRSAKEELPSPEIKPKTEAKTGLPAAKTPINTDDDATLDRLLSLDYVHQMADDEAMRELESFPGVGPKSASLSMPAVCHVQQLTCERPPASRSPAASCVLLFCLERDSFAVDTHVFRLSKALGWVPTRATRFVSLPSLPIAVSSFLQRSSFPGRRLTSTSTSASLRRSSIRSTSS
jgi:endonuclease III